MDLEHKTVLNHLAYCYGIRLLTYPYTLDRPPVLLQVKLSDPRPIAHLFLARIQCVALKPIAHPLPRFSSLAGK
ncbi:hypothetical protein C7B61_19440 [filamentous cyanobacterium CCP1]|nr:hypothetical protein C7B61_19440 [filamentous cyanobacterium CCP1]